MQKLQRVLRLQGVQGPQGLQEVQEVQEVQRVQGPRRLRVTLSSSHHTSPECTGAAEAAGSP